MNHVEEIIFSDYWDTNKGGRLHQEQQLLAIKTEVIKYQLKINKT